jgi:dipeptidyl-peptidase 4
MTDKQQTTPSNHTSRADENTVLARYQRAQTLMQGFYKHNIVPNTSVYPTWIADTDCCWYARQIKKEDEPIPAGKEYRLVDAQALTNTTAFDHQALAAALAEAVRQEVHPRDLPLGGLTMQLTPEPATIDTLRFTAFDKAWIYSPSTEALTEDPADPLSEQEIASPNGRYAAFTRNYNLWIKDLATQEERQLTFDGEELYCYAVTGNGWGADTGPGLQVRWSPDSQRLFTVQRDSRQVLTLPTVEHVPQDGSIRPKVRHTPMALPGDEHIPTYRLLTIEIATGKIQAANYHPVPITRNSHGFFDARLGWWGNDSRRVYFVDMARGYQTVRVVEVDTDTGATRVLFEETSTTYLSLMLNADVLPTFLPLPDSQELIWFSQRTGWAHLYLYSLETGELKHPLTTGEWVVRDITHIDTVRRELYIQTAGRVSDRDPYYRDLVRINLDTAELTTLAAGNYELTTIGSVNIPPDQSCLVDGAFGRYTPACSGISPNKNYHIVTRSRADTVPVTTLLNREGEELLTIESADMSALYAAISPTWQWPEPVKLLAADGKTDIYGLIYRPSDFTPEQSYPVVSHVFNSPELPWVAKGSFTQGRGVGHSYCDAAALAELGFVVVQIDGRGTPYRSEAFRDESYGWAESAGNLADHVAGIKQLGKRYPYLDLNRVGIYTPVGSPGALQGLLHYPEFYKVGVASLVNDSRLISTPMWSDQFEGLSGPSSDRQYPEDLAERLQGKLMIMHGMLDFVTPPAAIFRLIETLYKANKDFDLLLLPNLGHMTNGYTIRRAWDYLVRHLQGVTPPNDFKLITTWDAAAFLEFKDQSHE